MIGGSFTQVLAKKDEEGDLELKKVVLYKVVTEPDEASSSSSVDLTLVIQ
jgi:hypothetical protein